MCLLCVNSIGNPQVSHAVHASIPTQPTTHDPVGFQSKQAQDHAKWSRNEGDIIKTMTAKVHKINTKCMVDSKKIENNIYLSLHI
jgi:hypothetical protein